MKLIWQILSRLGVYPFAVYRRALYAEELQATSPPTGVEVVLGDAERLAPFAQNAEYQLSTKFIEQAFAEGHKVVLTYLDTRLAAYGWVSYSATPHSNGWWVEFAPGHRYNYKSYTLPAYRGQHLRGSYGVLQTPDKEQGVSHSIAFIALNNQASIRAEQRNGGRRVGYAGYIHFGPLRWSFRTTGARSVGFRFIYRPSSS